MDQCEPLVAGGLKLWVAGVEDKVHRRWATNRWVEYLRFGTSRWYLADLQRIVAECGAAGREAEGRGEAKEARRLLATEARLAEILEVRSRGIPPLPPREEPG